MAGLRKRIEGRVNREVDHSHRVLSKAEAALDVLLEVLDEGISLRLEIAGRPIPIKLIIEPDEEEGGDG